MENITLQIMTKTIARQYFRSFVMDPDLFLDKSQYRTFEYSDEFSDHRVDRYAQMGRVFLAVMLSDMPIGEVVLKEIDQDRKCCTLGISMANDNFKNRGYGTKAEMLALRYAFENLDMETVYADALITNLRSQHVLEKVGFLETHRNGSFVYYRCDRTSFSRQHT